MNTPDAVVSSISPDAWKRIAGGLLEIEALWHTYPHRNEGAYLNGKLYLSLAYDVFAVLGVRSLPVNFAKRSSKS